MKKLIIFIGALCVIIACYPITAFALSIEPDNYNWSAIAEDNNINLGDNYVIFANNGFYYIAVQTGYNSPNGSYENVEANSGTVSDISSLHFHYTNAVNHWYIYKSGSRYNAFANYSQVNNDTQATNLNYNISTLIYNKRGINYDNSLVISSSPIGSVSSGTGGSGSGGSGSGTGGSGSSSSSSNLGISSVLLSGVLDEVIGVLHIVVPVVITFIAIRKGIKFMLSLLRKA